MNQPSALRNMLRAAAGALPLVSRSDQVPSRTVTVEELPIDQTNVAEYAGVTGLRYGNNVPLTYPFALTFPAMMSLVTLSHHLGLMWGAMEATTLASAPSIYFNQNARSLEATWKYLLIGSVGIALALFGSLFLAYSSLKVGLESTLLFDQLIEAAPQLSPPWLHHGRRREANRLLVLHRRLRGRRQQRWRPRRQARCRPQRRRRAAVHPKQCRWQFPARRCRGLEGQGLRARAPWRYRWSADCRRSLP